jgi:glucokinase
MNSLREIIQTYAKVSTKKMSAHSVLLGDIGATNARLAFFRNGILGPVQTFPVAQHKTFLDVVERFLSGSDGSRPTQAMLAIAAPIKDGRATLTNSSWVIDTQEVWSTLKLRSRLINDFEAVAFSLPALGKNDLVQIGLGATVASAPKAVLGPGSGLGLACLVFAEGKPIAVASEGGHATLAATSEREAAVVNQLQQRFGHASFERAISGPGLENIYQALVTIDGSKLASRTAAAITQAALEGKCELAVEALDLFCRFLGLFAGNAALTFGAQGGVYIAGGIAPRILQFLMKSQFRQCFEAKGRFKTYMVAIPTYVIIHPAAAFVGLSHLLDYSPA